MSDPIKLELVRTAAWRVSGADLSFIADRVANHGGMSSHLASIALNRALGPAGRRFLLDHEERDYELELSEEMASGMISALKQRSGRGAPRDPDDVRKRCKILRDDLGHFRNQLRTAPLRDPLADPEAAGALESMLGS